MQSPLSKRNSAITYRISRVSMPKPDEYDLYVLQVYVVGDEQPSQANGTYRFDMLPQWMQDAIAALDVAGPGVGVPNIGRKIGSTFWIGEGLDGVLLGR